MRFLLPLAIALMCSVAFAFPPPKSDFAHTKKENRSITKDSKKYHYVSFAYDPPIEVSFDAYKHATVGSPESSAIVNFLAMIEKDYDVFMDGWTTEDAIKNLERNRNAGRDEAFWFGRWDKVLNGKRVMLTERIDYGKYVMIRYQMEDIKTGAPGFSHSLAYVLENDVWKQTNALSADPVRIYGFERGDLSAFGITR